MTATPLVPGDPVRLGAFQLVGRLGEGGQGVVYLGRAPDGEPVAVKLLYRADQESRRRLARELAAMESVAAFCTARVLTASVDGPRPYVVSEFVDGPSLDQRVKQGGPLRGGELERLVVGTATALAAIHAAGVVHRDFKPANVLLGPDGPRVVDFGIARDESAATHTSGLVGTPAYLSPEQISGSPASPASDVFAWAATMVCAASGRAPFGADTVPAVLHRVLTLHPDLSALPARYGALIASCLDKDPARRPTARDLMIGLVDPGTRTPPSTEDLVRLGSAIASPAGPPDGGAFPSGRPDGAGAPGDTGSPRDPAPTGFPRSGPGPGVPATPERTGPGRSALTTQTGRTRSRGLVAASVLVVVAVLATAGIVAWIALGDRLDGPGAATSTPTSATGSPPAESTASGPDGTASAEPSAAEPSASASSPPAGDGLEIPAAFAGTWSGHIKPSIPIGLKEHDVTISLEAGASSGKWTEPTSGCAGTLNLTKVTGSTLSFDLKQDDPAACVEGPLDLTQKGTDERTLAYRWVDGLGLGTTYTGDLTKSS
ncbi:serine/threonine-protein kinase [Planobispora longispora]|uniref:serine/threonine-protein kinase n=1 Tax=Planobispora longispora TaxID=28887 RepID=UPI001943CC3C|nr:serine/threonine-protein kinase [Planobispora longispora]